MTATPGMADASRMVVTSAPPTPKISAIQCRYPDGLPRTTPVQMPTLSPRSTRRASMAISVSSPWMPTGASGRPNTRSSRASSVRAANAAASTYRGTASLSPGATDLCAFDMAPPTFRHASDAPCAIPGGMSDASPGAGCATGAGSRAGGLAVRGSRRSASSARVSQKADDGIACRGAGDSTGDSSTGDSSTEGEFSGASARGRGPWPEGGPAPGAGGVRGIGPCFTGPCFTGPCLTRSARASR